MTHKRRLWLPGYWYHVFSRGQRKNPIFFSPADFNYFLAIMDETLSRHDVGMGAFCLMHNHYHMLVRMGKYPLEKALHDFHLKYAMHFNAKYATVGYVFQGRPGVRMVLKDEYLRYVVCYIHQNPYKEKKAGTKRNYRWSSEKLYREGTFHGSKLNCWATPPGVTRKNHNDPLENDKMDYLSGHFFIGTPDDFREIASKKQWQDYRKIKNAFGRIPIKECAQRSYTADELAAITSRSRDRKICRMRHRLIRDLLKKGYTTTELAGYLNCSRAAITQAVKT